MVGSGLTGLSAAWSLSRRGWAVDVLEAADHVGHVLAGSKGDARSFRLGYPELEYVAMAGAAGALWRELEHESGRQLLYITGQLSFGDTGMLEALADALADHPGAVVTLTQREAEARFPGVVVPGPALLEPRSGVLAADECLRALVEAGRFEVQCGAGTLVTGLDDDANGVTVRCADGRAIRTDVVVDCAGPGALQLLGGSLSAASVLLDGASSRNVTWWRAGSAPFLAKGLLDAMRRRSAAVRSSTAGESPKSWAIRCSIASTIASSFFEVAENTTLPDWM